MTIACGLSAARDLRSVREQFEEELRSIVRARSIAVCDGALAGPPPSNVMSFEIPAVAASQRARIEVVFDPRRTLDGWTCQVLEGAAHLAALLLEIERAHGRPPQFARGRDGAAPLIGSSQAIRLVRYRIERVAATDFTVLIEGSSRRLTTDNSDDLDPSWSKDGQWIYFSSNRTGRVEVWKMPANGGEAVQVTRGGGAGPAEFVGDDVYYRKGDGNSTTAWKTTITGGDEQQVFDKRLRWNNWAVTERGIYFISWESSIPSLQLFEFGSRQITEIAALGQGVTSNRFVEALAVSPDQRSFLYQDRSRFDFDLMLVEHFR